MEREFIVNYGGRYIHMSTLIRFYSVLIEHPSAETLSGQLQSMFKKNTIESSTVFWRLKDKSKYVNVVLFFEY